MSDGNKYIVAKIRLKGYIVNGANGRIQYNKMNLKGDIVNKVRWEKNTL